MEHFRLSKNPNLCPASISVDIKISIKMVIEIEPITERIDILLAAPEFIFGTLSMLFKFKNTE